MGNILQNSLDVTYEDFLKGVFGRIGCRQKKVRSAFGTGRKYFSPNVFKGHVKIGINYPEEIGIRVHVAGGGILRQVLI